MVILLTIKCKHTNGMERENPTDDERTFQASPVAFMIIYDKHTKISTYLKYRKLVYVYE